MGAVVTAFGTGAEMNNGAVITHVEKKQKAPLWGAFYDFAILDPAYTMSMSMKQVISGAFDALSHCMETYFGQPMEDNLTDEINEAVMRNVIKHIRATLADPEDRFARSELIWAAAMAENGILKIGKATDFHNEELLYRLFGDPRALLIPLALSAGVEIIQFIFSIGLCELDDIFNNTLGACIGWLMGMTLRPRHADTRRGDQ